MVDPLRFSWRSESLNLFQLDQLIDENIGLLQKLANMVANARIDNQNPCDLQV